MTRSAPSSSQSVYAWVASRTWSSTRAPISTTRTCRVANAPSNALEIWPSSRARSGAGGASDRLLSAESASDVVLGQTVARVGKDLVGLPDLDQVAHVEVRGTL